jgi:hypothetical protein
LQVADARPACRSLGSPCVNYRSLVGVYINGKGKKKPSTVYRSLAAGCTCKCSCVCSSCRQPTNLIRFMARRLHISCPIARSLSFSVIPGLDRRRFSDPIACCLNNVQKLVEACVYVCNAMISPTDTFLGSHIPIDIGHRV